MRCVLALSLILAVASANPAPSRPHGDLEFDSFWSVDEIYEYMAQMETNHPGFARVEVMGGTENGRQIRGIRIVNEEILAQGQLPIVFVTAGKVARDWTTSMVLVNLMHELLDYYEKYQHIVDTIDWFILPVANPDGYEFSRTEGNRDWIKNRHANNGSDCIGVHIERNFDFNWGLGSWSSTDPCNDAFRGSAPDSEQETKTIQFANDVFSPYQQAYVSIKGGTATAQSTIAYPFSSNNELFRQGFHNEIGVANIMSDAIWRHTGASYRTTSESNAVGMISGTSGDYAAGSANVPHVFSIYTPRASTGNAWEIPVTDINRIADEIFYSLVSLGEYVAQLGLPSASP